MPVYEYQCDHCEKIFEVRATFQEKERGLMPACPKCSSSETRQVISAGMFIHAGSGGDVLPSSFCGPSSRGGCCG